MPESDKRCFLIEGVLLEPLVRLVGALGVCIIDEVVRRSICVVGTHVCHESRPLVYAINCHVHVLEFEFHVAYQILTYTRCP
jgi:DNA-binding IclR family transcriptional regulator